MEGVRSVLESVTQLRPMSGAVESWLSSAVVGARLVTLLQEALALTSVLAYQAANDAQHTDPDEVSSLVTL